MKFSNKPRQENPNSKRRRRGQALVETALVLLVTLGMITFIMDMGRILLTQQYITERARVAVRNAVVNSWTATQVQNYVAYGSTASVDGNPSGLMGISPSQVTFTAYPDSGIGDARYQVIVQGVPLFTWVPYIAGQYTAPPVVATAPTQSLGATN